MWRRDRVCRSLRRDGSHRFEQSRQLHERFVQSRRLKQSPKSHAAAVCGIALALVGCSSAGVRRLGMITLQDGSTLEYIQAKTHGQSGPDVTVITEYHYDGQKSAKTGEYQGTAPGFVEVLSGGVLGATISAMGAVGAAKVRKPTLNTTNVDTINTEPQ